MQLDRFTIKAQEAIQQAQRLAEHHGHAEFDTDHLMTALLEQEGGVVPSVLEKLGVAPSMFLERLNQGMASKPTVQGAAADRHLARGLRETLERALKVAGDMNDDYVSAEHLFLAALEDGSSATGTAARDMNVRAEQVMDALKALRGGQRVTDQSPEDKYQALQKYGRDLTQAARSGKLDPVIGRDMEIRRVIQVLSRRTKNNPVLIGEPGVGKTAIAEGLAQRIVAGDVPEGLKDKMVVSLDIGSMLAGAKYRGEFEDRFKAFIQEVIEAQGGIVLFVDELHTLVGAGAAEGAVDASNMIKPALARGELRCVGATTLNEYRKYIEKDAALERRFQPVLVDEPTVEDTVAILRGLKERYELHHGVRIQDGALVASATLSHRYISDRFLPDKAIDLVDEAASRLRMEIDSRPTEIDEIERRLIQLEIEREALRKESDESSKAQLAALEDQISQSREILAAKTLHWEKEKELISELRGLTEAADILRAEEEKARRENELERAAEILYGKIPNIVKQVEDAQCRLAELQESQQMLKEEVTAEEIAQVVSQWTHVPVSKLLEGEKEKLLHIEDRLRDRLVGQKKAVCAVANAIRRARAGLQDPNRPLGSFLFMGPTGVGKTELARSLAAFLFDDEHAMVRIDMSEYMEKHSVSRLIGAPPGYIGHDQGGYLTEQVRRKPYTVVLFDEVEKAHPDVLNVLLQFLDDGRLTDGQGRTVNFTNTLVIMTSNLGSEIIQAALAGSSSWDDVEVRVMELLNRSFRPEFLNRLDETILFRGLTPEDLRSIVDIQLERVGGYLQDRRIELVCTDEAKAKLARDGYDPAFGARPLKRVIQRNVLDALAQEILDGRLQPGDAVLADVDPADESRLRFDVRREADRQSA